MSRRPQKLGDVLADLMARRGYAQVLKGEDYSAAWQEAAGETWARLSRPGQVRRGVLEVIVAHSTLLQELTFQKPQLIETLARVLPDEKIADVRFRVGRIT